MRQFIQYFQRLFSYPDDDFHSVLQNLISELKEYNDEEFNAILSNLNSAFTNYEGTRLQELYSHTFDWNPSSCLYMGYYLFGESYFRSTFLIKLQDAFNHYNYTPPGKEMADHLSILLEFCADYLPENESREFLETVVLLALDKFLNSSKVDEETLIKRFSKDKSYYYLLKALHYLLKSYISKEIIITTN